MSILALFCSVDALWQWFGPARERDLLAPGQHQRRRATRQPAASVDDLPAHCAVLVATHGGAAALPAVGR
jgi:hypothetical protein